MVSSEEGKDLRTRKRRAQHIRRNRRDTCCTVWSDSEVQAAKNGEEQDTQYSMTKMKNLEPI